MNDLLISYTKTNLVETRKDIKLYLLIDALIYDII